jgi:hypothetical protein
VARSKIFFYKTLIQYLSITNNEIVQNSKSEPKNSHSCVPLTTVSQCLQLAFLLASESGIYECLDWQPSQFINILGYMTYDASQSKSVSRA